MTNKTFLVITLSAMLAVTLAISAVAVTMPIAAAEDDLNDNVPNPDSALYDTYTDGWVYWFLSTPSEFNLSNPELEEVDCSVNQSGHVWYLAGAFAPIEDGMATNPGDILERDCLIPEGTKLLFPLANIFANDLTADGAESFNYLITTLASGSTDLVVVVDGVPLQNLELYQFQEFEAFEIDCQFEPFCDGQEFAVHAGNYIMINPLSPGQHTIEFGGSYPDLGFQTGALYNITVG